MSAPPDESGDLGGWVDSDEYKEWAKRNEYQLAKKAIAAVRNEPGVYGLYIALGNNYWICLGMGSRSGRLYVELLEEPGVGPIAAGRIDCDPADFADFVSEAFEPRPPSPNIYKRPRDEDGAAR
jgi:hypothetical protein